MGHLLKLKYALGTLECAYFIFESIPFRPITVQMRQNGLLCGLLLYLSKKCNSSKHSSDLPFRLYNQMCKCSLSTEEFAKALHFKKRFGIFPSPAGMSLTQLSLARNNLIIPRLGKFG
jgi:hypothetical protein